MLMLLNYEHLFNKKINEKLEGGGKFKRHGKKEILGKERCIYKKEGDRKEYVKHKGSFITVRDYKKLKPRRPVATYK